MIVFIIIIITIILTNVVLDRLLKDIVTESKAFDVESFVPALRERMYTRDRFDLLKVRPSYS